ncbi:hypothetical protein [uncultured Devosia sp.]|uniref:hypothetical protein n=1 Tax=uncultured Devosia sp. TaxID=211434 RepID=UPI0035CAD839
MGGNDKIEITSNDFDEIGKLIKIARNLSEDEFIFVDKISIKMSAPVAWEIVFDLSVADKVAEWGLYTLNSFEDADPLSLFRADESNAYCFQFLHWLEEVAAGRAAAFGIDMEGSYAALVASGQRSNPIVKLSAITYPSRLDFAVTIERRVLVRDIYTALIAYWESEALNAAWSQWSSKPKWSLRSAVVEHYLAQAARVW